MKEATFHNLFRGKVFIFRHISKIKLSENNISCNAKIKSRIEKLTFEGIIGFYPVFYYIYVFRDIMYLETLCYVI